MTAKCGIPRQRLQLRRTFIDFQDDGSLSPRAHSEPPQSAQETSMFEFERNYMHKLHESVRGAEVRRREGPLHEARDGSPSCCNLSRRGAVNATAVGTGAVSTVSLPRNEHGLPTRASWMKDRDANGPASPSRQWTKAGQEAAQSAIPQVGMLAGSFTLSLAVLQGMWRGPSGVWTIEEGGRCLFGGGHICTEYDITECAAGPSKVKRNDGWMVDIKKSDESTLVWTSPPSDDFVRNRMCDNRPKLEEPFAAPWMDGLQRGHLRSKMEASVRQLSEGWGNNGRLSAALAALEEIPKRIWDDMQNFSSHMVDSVEARVAVMSKQIRAGEWPAGLVDGSLQPQSKQQPCVSDWDGAKVAKVVRKLEAISNMAVHVLEARAEKTKATVRHPVHGVLQSLRAVQGDRWEDYEKLVLEMKVGFDEVEHLVGEAVEAAAEECRTHASRLLDAALAALREPENDRSQPAALGAFDQATWRGWQKREELWPKAYGAGAGSLKNSAEQAMALVQEEDYMPQCITNEVVADQLLRAKFRSAHSATQLGLDALKTEQQVSTNPGSRGHPDLCPQQCLYFAAGKCSNGNDCGFWHMPHPKRPVRFDKRMPFPELLLLILPIIRQKARDLTKCQEIDVLLEKLAKCTDVLGGGGFIGADESLAGIDQCGGGDGTASEGSSARRSHRSGTDAASECESRSSRQTDSIRRALFWRFW